MLLFDKTQTPLQSQWGFVLIKLLIYKVEETLRQLIGDGKMFLFKKVEVPVQVFGRFQELEEIKGQFLDKVVKVLDLGFNMFAELPENADVDLVGMVSQGDIDKYDASPVEESLSINPIPSVEGWSSFERNSL